MKLWIDDIRPAPAGWVWAKTSGMALSILNDYHVDEISFDHDLGGEDTAYPVACFIEEQAYGGVNNKMIWHIHSANPVGVKNIRSAMENADKYWHK